MTGRILMALGALTLASTGLTAPPAEARTVIRVGIGAPIYPRPYRWGYYRGYYAPPPPPRPYYYYRSLPVAVGPYWPRPRWGRPYRIYRRW